MLPLTVPPLSNLSPLGCVTLFSHKAILPARLGDSSPGLKEEARGVPLVVHRHFRVSRSYFDGGATVKVAVVLVVPGALVVMV